MDHEHAMDAYSAAVIGVADALLPSVAAVSVRTSRGAGAGSASVISPDGHLLTSAHVVAGADHVEVAFADGTELDAVVVGRDPLSDLAVLRADGGDASPGAVGGCRDPPRRAARRRARQPARPRRQRDRRRRLRTRPIAPDAGGPRGRRGDPDGCRAQPRQQRRRARRQRRPDGGREHRRRGRRCGPRRADQRDDARDHRVADDDRARPAGVARRRRRQGAAPTRDQRQGRIPRRHAGRRGRSRQPGGEGRCSARATSSSHSTAFR